MAQTLSKTGIGTSGTITAAQITQSIDALTGVSAFDITISGSLNINNAPLTNLTASGGVDFQGTTNLGIVDIDGAVDMASTLVIDSHITSSGNISSSFTSTGSFGRVSTSTLDLDSIQGNWTNAGNTVADLGAITTVDINGGTINGITDLAVADGGTGASTFTDGGVLLGSGTGAITAMAVLTDGQMIVGDGSTDPVAESGATLRTSIGVGTTDSVLFASITSSGAISSSGIITGEGLVISDDATIADNLTVSDTITTTDLIVENNVSGSGTIELAKKLKGSNNRDLGDTTTNLTTTIAPNGCLLSIELDNGTGGSKDLTHSLLPVATSLGRHFTIVCREAANSSCEYAISTQDSGVLQGLIVNSDSNEVVVNRTAITIGVSDTDRGDRIDLFCDGTFWYITFFRQGVAADTTLS
mgnify:CR=1 FL=1